MKVLISKFHLHYSNCYLALCILHLLMFSYIFVQHTLVSCWVIMRIMYSEMRSENLIERWSFCHARYFSMKVKFFLYTLWRYIRGVEIKLRPFFTSILDACEWQPHAWAALLSERAFRIVVEQEAACVPVPVWRVWRRQEVS